MSEISSTSNLKPIRQLPSIVINKIAAGEVIERPASVVKELIENSVDAGATQIELSIEKGGTELIRVTDNGCGIPPEQLELAVTSHATSKIIDDADLFRVGTFGFRGEALASISSVSQMSITSRTGDDDCATQLIINGGHSEPLQPVGAPVGTSISVKQLFYNTPVRKKFLRTAQTEKGHITEAFTRVALAHPEIQMTLLHNGKVHHKLAATNSWRDRIDAFFGAEISNALIPISSSHVGEQGEVSIEGFVCDPAVSRGNNKMQYLFLNHRHIRDRSLQHALSEAYRGLLMVGRYPICFLRLAMPFEMVDVNVHPAKLEVRFKNGGQIYSQLLGTLRNKFLTTDLTAKAHLDGRRKNPYAPVEPERTVVAGPTEHQDKIAFSNDTTAFDWTTGARPTAAPTANSGLASSNENPFAYQEPPRNPYAQPAADGTPSASPEHGLVHPAHADDANFQPPAPHTGMQKALAIQVHNTYLISETEEGMVIIDQHALHERIIYEQLREKVLDGKLESQKMLVPEPVTLPPADAAAVLEQAELLSGIGISVAPFGGDTVLVSAYPAMLANHNPAEMLRGVVEQLTTEGKNLDQRDLVDELLHMISCKAAIKAGDKLTAEEIEALLQHRELCQDAHHCPHGRPTSLVFSREDLDRKFKRI